MSDPSPLVLIEGHGNDPGREEVVEMKDNMNIEF